MDWSVEIYNNLLTSLDKPTNGGWEGHGEKSLILSKDINIETSLFFFFFENPTNYSVLGVNVINLV